MTRDDETSTSLADRLRVRLRHDPGDELHIDGRAKRAIWPEPFTRVGHELFAEVVIDLPSSIQSFPMEAWTGTPKELLEVAWIRTVNNTKFAIGEIDAGLSEPLMFISGEKPYITAFALCACTVFKKDSTPPFAAALAVPTPEWILMHLFADETLFKKDEIARRMASIARENYERYDPERRISPHVYLSRADQGFVLERLSAASEAPGQRK